MSDGGRPMRRVSELRAQFSKLLDAVAAGETLVITRYGEASRGAGARGPRRRHADRA